MAAYRKVWNMTAGVIGCAGLALALVALSIGVVAAMAIFGIIMGSALSWGVLDEDGADRGRRTLWGGAMTGGALVVLAGLTTALGAIGLLVVLVLCLTSPVVMRWLRHRPWSGQWSRSVREEPAANTSQPGAQTKSVGDATARALFAINPSTLDDAALCAAWQMTSVILEQQARTDVNQPMEVRRQLLDELERRHPAAFSAWLMARPGAADDLTAYFSGHEDPPPTAGSGHGR
jgi:hypothetical protein